MGETLLTDPLALVSRPRDSSTGGHTKNRGNAVSDVEASTHASITPGLTLYSPFCNDQGRGICPELGTTSSTCATPEFRDLLSEFRFRAPTMGQQIGGHTTDTSSAMSNIRSSMPASLHPGPIPCSTCMRNQGYGICTDLRATSQPCATPGPRKCADLST